MKKYLKKIRKENQTKMDSMMMGGDNPMDFMEFEEMGMGMGMMPGMEQSEGEKSLVDADFFNGLYLKQIQIFHFINHKLTDLFFSKLKLSLTTLMTKILNDKKGENSNPKTKINLSQKK